MAYAVPQLTDYGMSLLIRAIGGEQITFTRMAIGNGDVPAGTDPASLNNLINEQLSFGIASIEAADTGSVRIIGRFDSTEIVNDFRWKELGIFCKGEDDVEKLYAYCNDGNNAGMLKANASDVTAEQSVGLIVEVGTASSVTAIIAPSVLYVQQSEFDAHLQASNPHGIDKNTIGLGNVPNVSTNNQTPTYTIPSSASNLTSGETLSTAFGKIARTVMNMISHISNHSNPHGDTPESIGAADEEHTHSAADITSGTLSTIRGGTGKNTWSKNGIVYMNSSNNAFAQVSVPAVASVLAQNNGTPYWKTVKSIGKPMVKFVVGTTTNGHTADDCDYLCSGTNDQVVINSALAALPSTGGTVYILDGTYNTSGNIVFSKAGTVLAGAGATTINLGSENSAGYQIEIAKNNCTVRDLIVKGNIVPTNGIYAHDASRLLITGIRGNNICICCDTCTNSIVTNNFAGYNNGYNTGVYMLNGNGNLLSNNNVSGAWYCIRVESETNITVANNVSLSANECGLYCADCKNISISGNTVYSNVGGATTGCYLTSCINVTYTGNNVQLDSGASGTSCEFYQCQKIVIVGNTFKNTVSGNYAIRIRSCTYILHTHNIHMAISSTYCIGTSSNTNYQSDYNFSVVESS